MKLDRDLVAVVVGGASGMGAATVAALRNHDVHVALLDKNTELGAAVAERTGASFFPVDVMVDVEHVLAVRIAR